MLIGNRDNGGSLLTEPISTRRFGPGDRFSSWWLRLSGCAGFGGRVRPVADVEARRLAGRVRSACLPHSWTLNEFDFAAQPGVDEKLVRELAALRFLDDAGNVLFVDLPGTGKTMLAVALAREAVDAGHRVYFTTAAELANAAAKPPWKDAGPPRCGSTADRGCW